MWVISAPGKVILFGEHAVVYGCPSIAVSVGLRCCFHVSVFDKSASTSRSLITFDDISLKPLLLIDLVQLAEHTGLDSSEILTLARRAACVECAEQSPVWKSLCVCNYLLLRAIQKTEPNMGRDCDLKNRAICIKVVSEIPFSAGLGSSAAFAVAGAATFLLLSGYLDILDHAKLDGRQLDLITSLAHEAESIIHGVSSGVDTTVTCLGGGVNFRRVGERVTLKELQCPDNCEQIMIVNSMISRSTGDAVRGVADRLFRLPTETNRIFNQIHKIVDKATRILTYKEHVSWSVLGSLMRKNQQLLVELCVSCPTIDNIVSQLDNLGLTAKLTGAGCGGCLIAIPKGPDVDVYNAQQQVRQRGYWTQMVPIFVDGVRVTEMSS